MQKIIIEKKGGYDRLIVRTVDVPELRPDQYRIAVKYVGVNYADIIVREGYYTAAKGKYPLCPGFEYSGIVETAPKGAKAFKVGDEVCGFTKFGAYATTIDVDESSIVKVPKGWSLKEAAGLLVTNLTAYHGLRNVAHAKPGELLLVHSAAGGVGTSLLQQAKDLGCETIGVVSTESKLDVARSFGAAHTLLKTGRLWSEIDKICPEGLDVIFDANGLTTPRPGYERLKLGGRLVIYGFAELFPRGKRPFLPTLAYRSLKLPKFGIRNLTSTNRAIMGLNIIFLVDRKDLARPALDYITKMASNGTIAKPLVTEFPFYDAASSHQHLESGKSVGKAVLKIE